MYETGATKTRSGRRIWILVGLLMTLQVVIFTAGFVGVYVVDTVRAYVAGEGFYSKGEKRAVYHLRAYAQSGDRSHLIEYREAIAAPRAFGIARIILENPEFPMHHAVAPIVRGGLEAEDAWLASVAYRLVSDTDLLAPALEAWYAADRNIQAIDNLALEIEAFRERERRQPARLGELTRRIDALDARQTRYQTAFSNHMTYVAQRMRDGIIWTMLGLTAAVLVGGALVGRKTARDLSVAERRAEERQRLFRDIVTTTSDWVWQTGSDLRFNFFSDRMEEITGTPQDAVLGLTPWDLDACDGSDAWQRLRGRMAAQAPFRDFEYTRVGRDGRRRWYRISGIPYYDERGAFAGYRGTGTDITEERTARAEAAERRELLETTFETIPQGVTVVDADLCAKAFNSRFVDLLGFPEDLFAIGEPFETFIRYNAERGEYGQLDDVDAFVESAVARARRFEPHRFERIRPDGTVLEIQGVPLPSGGFVTTYTDITAHRRAAAELARARDEAERANKAKSDFLASMSHELRTPLNAVIGYAEMMSHEVLGPLGTSKYREYAGNIQTSGQYLLSLIQDVLDLSRIEAGKLELSPQDVDLASILDEVLTVQGRGGAESIRVNAPAQETVWCDPRALTQILVNVVGNAIKFSGGRPVDVRARFEGRWAVIEVEDQGPGISQQDLPRVTDPFYTRGRACMTAGATTEGTGLGLAIAAQLLQEVDGGLSIESELGVGTRVSIRLPRVEPLHAGQPKHATGGADPSA